MLNLPKNIYVMSLVMSLAFITTSMMVLVAAILGAAIAPDPKLATLPIAIMVVGTASGTIPAAMIMQRINRKAGMAVGICIALCGTAIAYHGAMTENFWLLVAGVFCIGFNAAFIQQGRFIILENAIGEQQKADGLTLALLANLLAAVMGPQLGAWGQHLVDSPAGFAGSFLFASSVLLLSLATLTQYQNQTQKPLPSVASEHTHAARTSLLSIAKRPAFILAAGSAAIGYAVMSLVMTATPVSMHEFSGHSLDHTKLVIQSHIVAMFLPSLLSGALIKKGLRHSLLATGLALYIVVTLIGFSGSAVMHYWWALALLGVGWNLLFMTSTTLLPSAYTEEERFRAQALNDFMVFGSQALAAFAAGWLLFNHGWNSVMWIALALSTAWLASLLVLHVLQLRRKPLESSAN